MSDSMLLCRLFVFLLSVVCVGCDNPARPASGFGHADRGLSEQGPDQNHVSLSLLASYRLLDPEEAIKRLDELSFFADGCFLTLDRGSHLVRLFSKSGEFEGYSDLPEGKPEQWSPFNVGVLRSSDHDVIWVQNRGVVRTYVRSSTIPSQVIQQNVRGPVCVGPTGRVYIRFVAGAHPPFTVMHLLGHNGILSSFLPADENNRWAGLGFSWTVVAFEHTGTLFAIRMLEPTVFKFSEEGKELGSWRLESTKWTRPFSRQFNPLHSTRNTQDIRAWERTFTTYTHMVVLETRGLLAVFGRNDPPHIPNIVSLYTLNGSYVGSIATDDYLVGSDSDDNLYFSNYDAIIEGICVIRQYRLDSQGTEQ